MKEIVLSILLVTLVFIIVFMIRNYLVYKFRMNILYSGNDWLEMYERLPSYESMLFDVWTWDFNKYLEKK